MKDPDLNDRDATLTRWIDGALTSAERAEFESMLTDPGQRRSADLEKQVIESLRSLLREHVPASVEPPYPDFFNSQVLKRIRDEQLQALSRKQTGNWFEWLRRAWFPALSAAAAVITVLAFVNIRREPTGTRVISVFSPEPDAVATAVAAPDAGAVIIDVQGLETYPSDRQVVGRSTDEPAALLASARP
jgi:anti-sigma factor RsiW